jgi:hypothetical protein
MWSTAAMRSSIIRMIIKKMIIVMISKTHRGRLANYPSLVPPSCQVGRREEGVTIGKS